jgi:catechol 2,3-dioxygenase-like lactoylglutathione lyase family enzyme
VSDRLARLGGVVLGVPDPPKTGSFLRECIGFAVCADGERITASCAGDYGPRGQVAIELRAAPELRLLEVTWEVSDAYDFEALAGRLAEREVQAARIETGLSFPDVAGNPLACVRANSRESASPADDPLRPRRLGHVNLKAPDPRATAAFYMEVLGMRLSEQIGENLYFLRVATEHHNVGVRSGEHAALHHLGLEIDGWNLYQPILDRLAAFDIKVEYGPGRHRPGNNLFAYVCDPSSGLRLELFADMAHIPDESVHLPQRWEAGERLTTTINRWGPTPPPSFLE